MNKDTQQMLTQVFVLHELQKKLQEKIDKIEEELADKNIYIDDSGVQL